MRGMEKAKRKAAERKADSRSGSANVPVIGCIAISSEPCSLWVDTDPSSLGVGMDPTVFRRRPATASIRVAEKPLGTLEAAPGGGSFGSSPWLAATPSLHADYSGRLHASYGNGAPGLHR